MKWTLITLTGQKGTKTYRYDIMVKANPNWLRQISDDLVLHIDFHDIIKNLDFLETVLKDKDTHTSLPVPLHDTAFHTQKKCFSQSKWCIVYRGRANRAVPGTGSCS